MPFGPALRGTMGGAGKAISGALNKSKPSNAPSSPSMGAGIGPTPQMLQQSQIPPMSPPPQPSDSMPMDQPMQPNPFQANPYSQSGIVPPQQSGQTGGGQSSIPPPPSPMQGSPMMGQRPMMRPGIGPSMPPQQGQPGIGPQPGQMGPQGMMHRRPMPGSM